MRNLICLSMGHKVARDRVWHDSLSYRSKCARCKVPIIRISRKWVELDSEAHTNPLRTSHPREH